MRAKPPTMDEVLKQCQARGWECFRHGQVLYFHYDEDGNAELSRYELQRMGPRAKEVESRVISSGPLSGDSGC